MLFYCVVCIIWILDTCGAYASGKSVSAIYSDESTESRGSSVIIRFEPVFSAIDEYSTVTDISSTRNSINASIHNDLSSLDLSPSYENQSKGHLADISEILNTIQENLDSPKHDNNPTHVWGQTAFEKAQKKLIENKHLNLHGIAMFRGLNAAGQFIGILTHSPVSHIALDLVDEDGQHYLYESTGSPREVQHFILPQVQIRPWDPQNPDYAGHVWTRALFFEPGYEPRADQVTELVKNYLGRPYETDMFELFGSVPSVVGKATRTVGYFVPFRPKASDNALFCSELVALILKKLGYLDEVTVPHHCLPKHFYKKHKNREPSYLTWQHASLGPQDIRRVEVHNFPCSIM